MKTIETTCSRKQFGDESGFTMMELLIVVVIIALMSAIAMPSIREWKQNADLGADTRRVYGFLQQARMEAVKRNANCTVTFVGPAISNSCLPNGNIALTAGVSFTGVPANIIFNGRGLPAAGTTITINGATGRAYQLVMNATGRVRIQ